MANKSYKKVITLAADFSQYTGSVDELNRKMKVLDADFKSQKAVIEASGYGVDDLSSRYNLLAGKMDLQKKVVEELNAKYEALNKMSDKNAQAVKATDDAQVKLYNAQTKLASMQKEVNDVMEDSLANFNDLTDAEEAAAKATEALGEKVKKQKKSWEDIQKSLKETSDKFDKIGDMTNKVGEGLTAGITVPMVAMGAAIAKSIESLSEFADEIGVMSEKTGMSMQSLQEWKYVTNQLDVSFDSIQTSMSAFTTKMKGLDSESGTAYETLKKLHVATKDVHGQMLPLNDIYTETIEKLSKMHNESQRNVMAATLFGKSWQEIAPILEAGGDEVKRLKEQAEKLGLVMSDEDINKAREFGDKWDTIKLQFSMATMQIGEKFLPIVEKLMTFIQESGIPKLQKFTERIEGLVTWFTNLSPALQGVVTTVALLVATIGPMLILVGKISTGVSGIMNLASAMNPAMIRTTAIIIGIAAALVAVVAAIAVLSGKSGEMQRTFAAIGSGVSSVTSSISSATTSRYASGTSYSRGGRALVGEEGPEIVDLPSGSQVYTASQSRSMTGGDTFILNVSMDKVGQVQQIIDTFEGLRQARRAGTVVIG